MVAALEASRLNEEMRRKGTKLRSKVTTEALQRVSDGKVKAVVQRHISEPEEDIPSPLTEPAGDSLFATPLPDADSPSEAGGEEETEPAKED
jgi:hypothetical protein